MNAASLSRAAIVGAYRRVYCPAPRRLRLLPSLVKRTVSTSHAKFAKFYTKKHEWVELSEDKVTGTVGITDYAQEALGDVVYAQLPDPDDKVEAGTECGALESVKAASDLFSPVSGIVIEKNAKVEDVPALINSSAEGKGWLFRLTLSNVDEVNELMNRDAYEGYLKSQEQDR